MPVTVLPISTAFGKGTAEKTSMAAQIDAKQDGKAQDVATNHYSDCGTSHLSILRAVLDNRTCPRF